MPKIHYEKRDRLVIITMEGDNDLNIGTVNEELHQRLLEYRDDEELWCCIVTGAGGRSFSAGADLNRALRGGFGTRGSAFWQTQPLNLLTGAEFWKPLIAAVNGHAIGAGFMLALACDIRIASENATFAISEVKFGWPAGQGAIQRITRAMPFGPALEVLLTGDRITAQQAYHWGLVNKVVPLPELMNTALEVADRIVANPPLAVRAVKELAYRSLELPFDQAHRLTNLLSSIARDTEDFQEATHAYAEKRRGQYKSR